MGQRLPTDDERFETTEISNSSESVEDTPQTIFDERQGVGSPVVDRTVYEDGDPEATVDCRDVAAGDSVNDPEQTVVDQRLGLVSSDLEQTVDKNGDPEVTIGAPVPSHDVDDATLDCDIEQTIAQQWRDTFTDETTPELTIKSDPNQTMVEDFNFSLKPRDVSREGESLIENPDYVRKKLLGEGGIGAVYAAQQKSIDRQVAIKVLKSRAARRESSRLSFVSEAMITGELDHPNIVPVYDLGLDSASNPFYVMKQVQGVEWADRIRDNSLRENLDILLRVADAIAMAHARGIIHRDLKPANVMLGEFGEVLVMDWGLASPAPDSPRRDSFPKARFGGTPCYMAPEMASGPVDQVDRRSDIYLLGAILFEILTGSTPHPQKTVKECLRCAAENEIVDTGESGLLIDVALKAMSTLPKDRYQAVAEFQDAVQEYFIHLESISLAEHGEEHLEKAQATGEYDDYSRAVFAYEQARELWPENDAAESGLSAARLAYAGSALRKGDHDLCGSVLDMEDPAHTELRLKLYEDITTKRRADQERSRRIQLVQRIAIGLIAFIVVTVVVAFVWITSERNNALTAQKNAEDAQLEEAAQRTIAEDAQRESKLRNSQLNESTGLEYLKSGDEFGSLVYLTDALASDSETGASTGLGGDVKSDSQLTRAHVDTAYQAAGRDWNHRTRLASLVNSPVRLKQLWYKPSIQAVGLSPDAGLVAAVTASGEMWVWDVDSGQPVIDPIQCRDSAINGFGDLVTFSPDGRLILTGSIGTELRVWNARDGRPLGSANDHLASKAPSSLQATFTADSQELLFSDASHLWKWDLDSDFREPLDHESNGGQLDVLALSRDGTRVATHDAVTMMMKVISIEDESGVELQGDASDRITFSADALWISSLDGPMVRIWDTQTGNRVADIDIKNDAVTSQFSPDGLRITTSDVTGIVRVWEVQTGRQLYTPIRHSDVARVVTFSGDGRFVASYGDDYTTRVWDLWTGRPITPPLWHSRPVQSAAFSSDGRLLLTATRAGEIRIWELHVADHKTFEFAHSERINAAVFLPSSGPERPLRLATASDDGTARIWNVETGKSTLAPLKHGPPIKSIQYNATHDWLITAGKTARIWHSASGASRNSFDETVAPLFTRSDVTQAPVSPNGQIMLLPFWRWHTDESVSKVKIYREALEVFDLQSQELIDRDRWKRTDGRIHTLQFLNDGSQVLVGADDGTSVWNLNTGAHTPEFAFPSSRTAFAALLADDLQFLAISHDGEASVVDIETAEAVRTFYVGESTGLAVSPDRQRFATVHNPGDVRVWNPNTGSAETSRLGHDGPVTHVVFSPVIPGDSGQPYFLLTASEDRTARLWNVETVQTVMLLPHDSDVTVAQFSPDGRQLVTATDRGVATLWTIPHPLETAPGTCQEIARVLSARTTDGHGGFRILSPDELVESWHLCQDSVRADSRAVRSKDAGFVSALFPKLVAHRGASYDFPENTITAFEEAWVQGADAIEGDFRLTADGHIIAMHDPTTKDTADSNLAVVDSTLEQLLELDAGSWKSPRFAGEKIPLLSDVLATVPEGKQILIEVKCGPELIPRLKDVLQDAAVSADQIIVIAFNHEVISESKRLLPDIRAFWLKNLRGSRYSRDPARAVAESLTTLKQCNADGLSFSSDSAALRAKLIPALRNAGLSIHCWTVDDLVVADELHRLGVDSITTNRAGWLRRRLNGAGESLYQHRQIHLPLDEDINDHSVNKQLGEIYYHQAVRPRTLPELSPEGRPLTVESQGRRGMALPDKHSIGVTYRLPDEGTISAWYFTRPWYEFQTVFDNSAHTDAWEMWIYGNGLLRFRCNPKGPSVSYPLRESDINKWHHFAVAWDRTDRSRHGLKLYVNGRKVDHAAVAEDQWVEPGGTFYLGGGRNTHGRGVWDDVMIFDIALSEKDIQRVSGTGSD